MEFENIGEFRDYLIDFSNKYKRYEYVNPFFKKGKKPNPFKSVYLKINDRFNLFYIYENTTIYSMSQLGLFLSDYLDGLFPEIKAPFEFERVAGQKKLRPLSLKRIDGLNIVWVGKAVNPDKGEF